MKTVLITAIGSFSAAAAIRTCREKLGWRVIGTDIYPFEWIANAMEVEVFYQAPPATDPDAYMDFLCKVCREENVDFLQPSTDAEVDVLSARRKNLPEGVTLCLSGPKTIEICRDKFAFSQKISCAIPTRWMKDVPEPELPCIVKPVNGRSSQGLHRVARREEYALIDPENMIVQPLIEGDVIAVDVVRHPKSHYTEVLGRQELLRTPNGAGTSVKIIRDSELEAMCQDIAAELGITGCVCFEFLRDPDGKYHMLECNPRFSGGIAFSQAAGYDFVAAHFACFTEKDIDVKGDIPERYIARRYEEYLM